MAIEQILSSYLLNPIGLLALAGIIPIIIFYLTRPEPEKKVIPSMQFFQEKEEQTQLQKALNMIKSNIILILNILAITLFALGLAGLYAEGTGTDQTVIIYDASASMHEEHAEAVSTVLSKASTENTLIIAGENIETYEGLNRQAAADLIRDNPPGYTDSDMRAALQQAQAYEGSILLLSNLDESESVLNQYADLGSERGIEQIDYSTENRWGFTGVGNSYVEIMNYRENAVRTTLSINSENQEIELEPGENKRVEVEFEEGENTLELPNDGFSPDNQVYVYMPGDEKVEVEYHGPENQYLETALEEIETVEKSDNGDVIILNTEDEDLYESERPKILMQGSSSHWSSSRTEQSVELDSPFSTQFESVVYSIESVEPSYSTPEEALFRDEATFYFNIDDQRVRTDFVYPVIWKNMIHGLEEPEDFESVNQDIRFSEQSTPGFHDGKAVNYLKESDISFNQIDEEITVSGIPVNQSQIIALLLIILLSAETLVMLQKGVYQ